MRKVFVINGGQVFTHSKGQFNATLVELDIETLRDKYNLEVRVTDINDEYDLQTEVDNFVWADLIIYHVPVWWFGLPHGLKEYLDKVLTHGHRNGLYYSDGRKNESPNLNYGRGGSLLGRKYMVTSSWNAPKTAFTLKGEFFNQTSVDEGVLFGLHRMNSFLSLEPIEGMHFYDIEKNGTEEKITLYKQQYKDHLDRVVESI
ncbi:MAG: NAD(P)H-dependent oxidoreductase [Flavobacterium sp.]